jgi:hypothetical protein
MKTFSRVCLLATAGVILAFGTPIPGLVSTGSGANPTGTLDPAWQYFYSPTPVSSGFSFKPAYITSDSSWPLSPPVWLANDMNSRWISPSQGYGTSFDIYGDLPGYYYYLLPFTIGPGYLPSTGYFTFQVAVDNVLNSIWVNGNYIPYSQYGYTGFSSFGAPPVSVSAGLLQSGLNQLVVVVYNSASSAPPDPENINSWNPNGLRVEILESFIQEAPIPEPAAFFLCGAGLACLGLLKLRRG